MNLLVRSVSKFGARSGLQIAPRLAPFSVKITESSWAADKLKEMGVPVEPDDNSEVQFLEDNFLENPPEKVIKLVDEILTLNVVEMVQLQRRFQRRLGVDRKTVEQAFTHSLTAQNMVFSGHVPTAGGGGLGAEEEEGPANGAAAAAPVVKDAFDLKLKVVDAKAKIKVIKEVRVITGLGLKEAKELVEKTPVLVKPGLKKEEAEAFKKLLVDAGAEVELV